MTKKANVIKLDLKHMPVRLEADLIDKINYYRMRENMTWREFINLLLKIWESGIPRKDRYGYDK